jgi:hypothetical protein
LSAAAFAAAVASAALFSAAELCPELDAPTAAVVVGLIVRGEAAPAITNSNTKAARVPETINLVFCVHRLRNISTKPTGKQNKMDRRTQKVARPPLGADSGAGGGP